MSEKMAARKFNRSNLRRLVRGRAYTSVAQIRRYFGIASEDVSRLEGPQGSAFVALPGVAANILGRLWQEGRIGVEWVLEVRAALVDGVYSTEVPVRGV